MTKDESADIKHFITGELTGLKQYMDKRFDGIDSRLDRVEDRLDRVEDRLDRVEDRLGRVEDRLDRVENRLDAVESRTAKLERTLTAAVQRFDKKIDDLSASVAQAIDAANEACAEQHKEHRLRLAYLEGKLA